MFISLFFLLERIKRPIGEANYIPKLSGINLSQFISKNPYSIIIFADKKARFDFINFAVYKFGTQISFAVASKDEAISPKCEQSSFCIVPYQRGNRIQTNEAPDSVIAFANWCEKIIRPPNAFINHIDQLRRIFQEPGTFLFGVDMVSCPSYLKTDIPFYRVDSTLFNFLNISVSAGLYIYRSADRQLIKANENYKKFLKSPIVDLALINITSKPYFGGFFVDRNNIKGTNEEVSILTKLANKYQNINFALIEGDIAEEISLLSSLQYIKRPFFVLFNSSEVNQNRYILESKDTNEIDDFVKSVLAGETQFTKLNGSTDEINLNYNNFKTTISTRPGDKLVLFTNERIHLSKKLFLLCEKAKSLINSPKFNVFRYDLSANDIPESLQIEQNLPILVLYPEGKDEIYYDSDSTIEDIMSFLSFGVSNKFKMPEFDSSAIFKEINEKMNPKFTAFKQKLAEERKKQASEEVKDDSL